MNTREIASEYRLTHWAEIMSERRESGLNIKSYCEKAGIHENVYYYWQRKLREEACEQLTEHQDTALIVTGFTEVKMAGQTAKSAVVEAAHSSKIYVEIGGIKISADDTYPPDKLASDCRQTGIQAMLESLFWQNKEKD